MAYAGLRRIPARSRASRADNLEVKAFPAPTKGWVSAANLAAVKPGFAYTLENWFPTTTGIKLRRGNQKKGTCHASEAVESLMSYIGGATRKMFAGCNGSIFEMTNPASTTVPPTADVTGQTSDYYSALNFATTGGNYMTVVNGTDSLLLYDGTYFYPVTGTALSRLDYDNETANFVVGGTLTGGTSGATASIVKVIDSGTTGTLWIRISAGTFQDNETITGSLGGSAQANGVTSTLAAAITGVTTSTLRHVWGYRNRQWFVEKNTMKAWYLPVDSVGGAAASVNLAGVFQKGGSLILGATWSMDSGDGLDDKIVFISSEGEYAIYQGDPASASTWSIVGRYDGSPPLGRNQNGTMRAGADLLILTESGIIPLSAIIAKDPAALGLAAVTAAIAPDWISEAASRKGLPWEIIKWPSRSMAIVNCPITSTSQSKISFVVNIETGAWCKYTGWDTRCLTLHDDYVYFGTNSGTVLQAEITGADSGALYYSTYVGHMDHLGAIGYIKTIKQARGTFRTLNDFIPKISVSTDYVVSLPTAPNAGNPTASPAEWDVGLWDVAKWDTGLSYYVYSTMWVSIGETGYAHAPQVQVTNGAVASPSAELILIEVTLERGGLVV